MMVEIIKAASIPYAMTIIGLLVWAALSKGIDGSVLMSGLAIVGGLGGFYVKHLMGKK